MNHKLCRTAIAVVAATTVIEAVQHGLMRYVSMTSYHVVSAVLTLVLVAIAAWQMETRVRLLEASTQADVLEEANTELKIALDELLRCDRLAAAGAIAKPLYEQLKPLALELRETGVAPELVEKVDALLSEFQALAKQSLDAMRPVDLGALCDWVVSELSGARDAPVTCIRSDRPIWVKAHPGRLEMALRHFIAHAADGSQVGPLVVVADASDSRASVAIACARRPSAAPPSSADTLNWRIASAVVTECGGEVAVQDDPKGIAYILHLPLGPRPGRPSHDRSQPSAAVGARAQAR